MTQAEILKEIKPLIFQDESIHSIEIRKRKNHLEVRTENSKGIIENKQLKYKLTKD